MKRFNTKIQRHKGAKKFLRDALIYITALILLAALWLGMTPAPALACTTTPTGIPSWTFDQEVNRAPIILEGTVTEISGDWDRGQQVATVKVLRYFKGVGPEMVSISGFGTSAMCLTTVDVGDHWIFFAAGDPRTGLYASYISAGAAYTSPNQADAIVAITGQHPTLPLAGQDQTPLMPSVGPDELMIFVTVSLLLAVLRWILHR